MKKKKQEKKFSVPISSQSKKLGRKISTNVKIRKDFIKKDGTAQLYINISSGSKRKKIYLNLYCQPENFDEKIQRVVKKQKNYKDINLIIERELSKIYAIELDFRLRDQYFEIQDLINIYKNPTLHQDFFTFWEKQMERQKELLAPNTYRQQKSSLKILREWKQNLLFQEITDENIIKLKSYLKSKRKNTDATISIHIKNFKKYLHLAEKKGLKAPISYQELKITKPSSRKVFLSKNEIKTLDQYYFSIFIEKTHKEILSRFLFSIFTGIRISDIQRINKSNIHHQTLFLTTKKTNKIQQIPLSKSAKRYIDLTSDYLFHGKYTDQHINRVLKQIARKLKIRKNITFHVARHTFATQWLLNGGDVVNLQAALGHSNIRETMTYVHLVNNITEKQFNLLDNLLD